jgi:hypothetical protein
MTDEIDHVRLREENLIDNYHIATGVGALGWLLFSERMSDKTKKKL